MSEEVIPNSGFIRTVTGDNFSEDLGIILGHEHLITRPADHLLDEEDLLLNDETKSIKELSIFKGAGGGCVVELTTAEFGRDVFALKRISRATGIAVVATTGHVAQEYWRDVIDVDSMDSVEMFEEMVQDLLVGFSGTAIKAGIIKAGSSKHEITPAENRILNAAAKAQIHTGAPITTHTTAGTMAIEQAKILLKAGANPDHVYLGHLDRDLNFDLHLNLLKMGFHLGYDCASKEWYEPDSKRIQFILRFFELGFGSRICLSGDLARRSSLTSWGGGPGYTHIPWRIIPWLRREGLQSEEITQLTKNNLLQLLRWQKNN
jgi:phosphotriesterase-related protein